MFVVEQKSRFICFIILAFSICYFGPAISDFTLESWVEYIVFYINLLVLFFAGVYMRGHLNRRAALVFGVSLIANHYIFY